MAKCCCICKRKLSFLNNGFELGNPGTQYFLCSDCNEKRLDIRSAKTEQELKGRIGYFSELLNDPQTPIDVIDSIKTVTHQALGNIKKAKAAEKNEDDKRKKIEQDGYAFTTEMRTLMEHYRSVVSVSKSKVIVKREGKTSLPAETTIYFKDATSVSWGNVVGRSWISFTVPGATSQGRNAVITSKTIAVGFSGPSVPYEDPFSIVFGMNQEDDAKEHFKIVKKMFDTFKENSVDTPISVTTIQQDNAVDKLKKLKELKDMGILSDTEYEEKRKKLLAEI